MIDEVRQGSERIHSIRIPIPISPLQKTLNGRQHQQQATPVALFQFQFRLGFEFGFGILEPDSNENKNKEHGRT